LRHIIYGGNPPPQSICNKEEQEEQEQPTPDPQPPQQPQQPKIQLPPDNNDDGASGAPSERNVNRDADGDTGNSQSTVRRVVRSTNNRSGDTCLNLPSWIHVFPYTQGVNCQILNGAGIGVQSIIDAGPLRDFAFRCASNPEAIRPSPDQFTFFQGGGFDRSLLSFVEVDGAGSVNVSRLSAIPHITSGIGGFIDITTGARSIVFSGNFTAGGLIADVENGRLRIQREGRFKKFVPQIEAQTFSGEMALKRGQEITYITERCVLALDENGLTITEIAPGARLQEDLLDQADIPLRVSPNLRQMPAEIFQPEPMGLQLTPKAKAQ